MQLPSLAGEDARRVTPAELQTLHARLRCCRLCLEAGYEIFPRAIFSGGVGAQIMVIGQAPGITEKEAGRPFNAGSGKRLFAWLACLTRSHPQAGLHGQFSRLGADNISLPTVLAFQLDCCMPNLKAVMQLFLQSRH